MMEENWIKDVLQTLAGMAIGLLICAMLGSCRSSQCGVTDGMMLRDTVYQNHVRVDSVYQLDSVYFYQLEKGDTVIIHRDRFRTIYKERWLTDTLYKAKTDTITRTITQTVEKKLTTWQQIRIWIGNLVLICAFFGFMLFCLALYKEWKK